jgi:hypothetical protein
MTQVTYLAYDEKASVLSAATADRARAEHIGLSMAESQKCPGYVLIRGQNHWALRLNPDRSKTELSGDEIPAKIRQANAR